MSQIHLDYILNFPIKGAATDYPTDEILAISDDFSPLREGSYDPHDFSWCGPEVPVPAPGVYYVSDTDEFTYCFVVNSLQYFMFSSLG